MVDRKKPTKPGFYWAKSNQNSTDWDCIVSVDGTAPYLSYKCWMFKDHTIGSGSDPAKFIFGPKVRDPKPIKKNET